MNMQGINFQAFGDGLVQGRQAADAHALNQQRLQYLAIANREATQKLQDQAAVSAITKQAAQQGGTPEQQATRRAQLLAQQGLGPEADAALAQAHTLVTNAHQEAIGKINLGLDKLKSTQAELGTIGHFLIGKPSAAKYAQAMMLADQVYGAQNNPLHGKPYSPENFRAAQQAAMSFSDEIQLAKVNGENALKQATLALKAAQDKFNAQDKAQRTAAIQQRANADSARAAYATSHEAWLHSKSQEYRDVAGYSATPEGFQAWLKTQPPYQGPGGQAAQPAADAKIVQLAKQYPTEAALGKAFQSGQIDEATATQVFNYLKGHGGGQ